MSNSFLSIKQNMLKILTKRSEPRVDDDNWIERLWAWADKNVIPDLQWQVEYDDSGYWTGLPRDKDTLLLLQELDLEFNHQFTELPVEIGNLVNLKSLSIRHTSFTKLPKEIGNLMNLEWLTLDNNSLTELPKEIGNLVNLKGLYLWGNNLTLLPHEIGNLTNLEWLYLQDNNISEVPKEIENLMNLKWLLLEDNSLNGLPDEITGLVNLNRIDLENNPNIIFTQEQRKWLSQLILDDFVVRIDDDDFLNDARAIKNINSIDFPENEIPF